MRKPNYRFERAERDRAKKARNDKKLQRQQERAAPRAEDVTPRTDGGEQAARSLIDAGIIFRRRCSDEPTAVYRRTGLGSL